MFVKLLHLLYLLY